MPIKIRIYGKEAIYSSGSWACDDDALQAMLQSLVDPRMVDRDGHEREHAFYAAGRFGGLVLVEHGWVPADHPPPEITMEDLTGRPAPREETRAGGQKGGGWLSWLKRKG